MRIAVIWTLVLVLATGVPAAAAPELNTDDQKTLYALGLVLARNLAGFTLSEAELQAVQAGLADGILHRKPQVELEAWGPKIQDMQKARAAAAAAGEKKEGQAFAARAAGEKGATRTSSGLVITTLKAGGGPSPKKTDRVKVHYTGTLTDGTVFDSSVKRGEPVVFPLDGVIPCWTEALQLMKVGDKSRVVCPSDLAYGDRGAPPRIKPGATLVFEVELLDIVR